MALLSGFTGRYLFKASLVRLLNPVMMADVWAVSITIRLYACPKEMLSSSH